jgi:hypothetical protein
MGKHLYSMEIHATSADELLHSKEAYASLIRGIGTEREKERDWKKRNLLSTATKA